jgi:hypothetical protein
MTRLALLLAFIGTIAVVAVGAAEPAKKKGVVKSLDPANGYFHQVHTKTLNMNCISCHSSDNRDLLFLRKDDAVPAAMPGQVNRSICLGCHTAPSKPAWYGLSR